ncbi:MAG: YlxR family protein [Ruthenibacterium sp.]
MTPKKIPLRRCMGCNESKPKKELVRVVKNSAGEIALDRTGKMPGRGAYVCPNAACLAKARKARRFERALDCQIPAEVYDAMAADVEKGESGAG